MALPISVPLALGTSRGGGGDCWPPIVLPNGRVLSAEALTIFQAMGGARTAASITTYHNTHTQLLTLTRYTADLPVVVQAPRLPNPPIVHLYKYRGHLMEPTCLLHGHRITKKARKRRIKSADQGQDLVSDSYLYVEISPFHVRMQTLRPSGRCLKLGSYHFDQDRAKLLGDKLVAQVVGMHLVALQHVVGVTRCTRDIGDCDRRLCSGVLLYPARDFRINRLDGLVAPLRRDDLVYLVAGNEH